MLYSLFSNSFSDDIPTKIGMYSPLCFNTDFGDELPSLTLPTKRKSKCDKRRCQRVDMQTHIEVQKILQGKVIFTEIYLYM
jgi:hypothetical protein